MPAIGPGIEVVSALIVRNGRVLLTQRRADNAHFPLAWESPGGKVEGGVESHRDALAREPLQPHNGRNALIDAYQEALDLVVYLRQALEECKGGGNDFFELTEMYTRALNLVVDLRSYLR